MINCKLFAAFMLAACIFGASKLDCMAVQLNYKPIKELPSGAVKLDYIELGAESGSYEVKPGDTDIELLPNARFLDFYEEN